MFFTDWFDRQSANPKTPITSSRPYPAFCGRWLFLDGWSTQALGLGLDLSLWIWHVCFSVVTVVVHLSL